MKKIAILTVVLMLIASTAAFTDGIGAFSAFKNGIGARALPSATIRRRWYGTRQDWRS